MSERRREAAHLDRLVARHQQCEAGTAVALLELERRPGHRMLDDGGVDGRTARRFVAARATRDQLWRDFLRYSGVVAAAATTDRRTGPAERGRLLQDADALLRDVRAALHELQALAAACETAHSSALAALAPIAQQLTAARHTAAELELGADDPDAVTLRELADRASDLERTVAGNVLAFAGTPDRPELASLAGAVDELGTRLAALTRLRDGWAAVPDGLDRDLDGLAERRAQVLRARARAGAELRDTLPARPPDRGPGLRELRAAVTAATGWRERHDAVVALRERITHARRELDTTAALVAEQLERRDDLRGRFGAYRARTGRLGCADDPELLELAGRIGHRLWAVPSELARATRDLAAYRRRLAALSTR